MLVITCPTTATEIALGAVPPMGQVVSPSRKLDYIFNRVLRMSRHRRLATDAAAALYMLPHAGAGRRVAAATSSARRM
jgi:hypothetical protein